MLNKEQKQTAEKMAQELAPLYAIASKLADKWIKAAKKERRAFGKLSPRSCFVLILENPEEEERAYLVRANW